jgi:hypothetical protein
MSFHIKIKGKGYLLHFFKFILSQQFLRRMRKNINM